MEFEIQAGTRITTTTPAELREELRAWHAELARGVKFRQIMVEAVVSGGAFSYVPDRPGYDKLDSGMSWKVMSVACGGAGFVAGTDTFDYFLGDTSPSRVIASGITDQDRPQIVIGDQPEMDFGGARQPDGQGFAAFGRVVAGMDVVRAIQMGPAKGETLTREVAIVRIRRR